MTSKDEIEEFVRSRKPVQAQKAIRAYLHRSKESDRLFRACDWYRRLGLYEEAYRLLDPRRPASSRVTTESDRGRRLLWAARMLNLAGASHFAKQMIFSLKPTTAEDHKIMGNILNSNFDYHPAMEHFERMRELEPEPESYLSRVALLGLADALAGQDDFNSAISLASSILARSPESYLQGVCKQAIGEYLARSGKHRQGLRELRAAKKFFPTEDESADMGYLLKWTGFCIGKLGGADKAREYLDRSERILRKPGARPEPWIDVYRIRHDLGLIKGGTLNLYPGLSPSYSRLLKSSSIEGGYLGSRKAAIVIDVNSRECWLRGVPQLYLPLEVRFLMHLRLAQPWGISLVRMLSVMWPEEVYSFLQLEPRIHKLISRLRTIYGIRVRLQGRVLHLSDEKKVGLRVGGVLRPSFLSRQGEFRGVEMQKFYRLKRTQANHYLREWVEEGWIVAKGKGPSRRYHVQ